MTEIAFRLAETRDAELVRDISAEAYIPAYQPIIGTAPLPALEDYGPRIAQKEVWILEAHGEDVGVAVFEPQPAYLLVYSIAVRPGYQGQGYGKALLAFADTCAANAGLEQVRLYTNRRMTRNLALYARCGFVETGQRPHPSRPGEYLVDLAKTVNTG